MKLDVNALRYLSKDEFRVLTAVELGQKNHEIVPMALIDSIAGLKHGGSQRCLRALLRWKLVHHDSSKYEGYRLTYMGYDFLAIKALVNRGAIASVGRQIGVGKESDVFEVLDDEGEVLALKLHRLGRTSFRAVKSKRDYLKHRTSFSWLYLSRLAALKEHAFMEALGRAGFPVPEARGSSRHAVLMTMVDACPLAQVGKLENPGEVYRKIMALMTRLAEAGLVHCDFNEFNILVDDEENITLIDFPQMVSVSHANARELFDRDVDCLVRFFNRKLGYLPEDDPTLAYERPDFDAILAAAAARDLVPERMDAALAASGFQKKHQEALEQYRQEGGSSEEDSEAESDEVEEASDDRDSSGNAAELASPADESADGGPHSDGDQEQPITASKASASAAAVPSPSEPGGIIERDGEPEPHGADAGSEEEGGLRDALGHLEVCADGRSRLANDEAGPDSGSGLEEEDQESRQEGRGEGPREQQVRLRLQEQQKRAARRATTRSATRNAYKEGSRRGRKSTTQSIFG